MQRGGFILGDHRESGHIFIIYHYEIHYRSMTKFALRKLTAAMDVLGVDK